MEVIRSSYYTIMRKLQQHPDLGGDHWNAATINEAYEVLSDEKTRTDYDKKLFHDYTQKLHADERDSRKSLHTIFCPFCKYPLARETEPPNVCPQCKSPLLEDNPDKNTTSCRRVLQRLKVRGKIRFYCHWPEKGLEAEIVDMSPNGMRFRCVKKLERNAIIKITNPAFIAIAQIVDICKIHKLSLYYDVGVKFVAVKFSNQTGMFYSLSC